MEDTEKRRKNYLPIGESRLLNIKVIVDGNLVYEGMVEDAPDEIKEMKYYKIEMGNPIIYYVDSSLNN